jgi:hypothetical protein
MTIRHAFPGKEFSKEDAKHKVDRLFDTVGDGTGVTEMAASPAV